MGLVYTRSSGNVNILKSRRLSLPITFSFLMNCKVHDVVPKDVTLEAPYHSHRSSETTLQASKFLLRERIRFYHFESVTPTDQIDDLGTFFQRSISQSHQLYILVAVESSFKHLILTQMKLQIWKFWALKYLHQSTSNPKAIYGSRNLFLIYQSKFSQNYNICA
jgi:hypothetical protein